jgi:DNA-binding NarL/FixJ family response regulator
MPLLNGIEAARQIRENAPETRMIILTQQSNAAYVQEAFRAGASAYVLNQSAAAELLTGLSEAFHGRYYVSRVLTDGGIAARFDPNMNPSELFGGVLTRRQREVLQLIAEGNQQKRSQRF